MLPNLAGDLWFTRLTWKRTTANKTRTEDLKINPEYLEKEGSKKSKDNNRNPWLYNPWNRNNIT